MFSEILHVPDLSHFHGQKSGDKSGFGDKSGCDKSEDGQYDFYEKRNYEFSRNITKISIFIFSAKLRL